MQGAGASLAVGAAARARARRLERRPLPPGGISGGPEPGAEPERTGRARVLVGAQGRPVTAEELLEKVWDEMADPFTTTIKTTIGPAPGQARRPARDRDRPRGRLPDLREMAPTVASSSRFSWLRLPRRTARLRLTLFYGGLFLVSGVVLLAITNLLVRSTDRQLRFLPDVGKWLPKPNNVRPNKHCSPTAPPCP